MPIDILHVLGTAQPEGTGIARIVGALAAGLDPSRYHVHAWFLGPPGPLVDELRAAGATARSVPWPRGARDPLGAYRFWRSLRRHDFAIVHQHFGARSIRGVVSLSSAARIVLHLHGRISESGAERNNPAANRGADAVIAASRAVALAAPELNPVVVHAGVALPVDASQPEPRTSRETVVIGTAGRLVPLKGLMHLLRSVASLAPQFPDLRLEIAGQGPQRDELEDEARRLGLTGRMRFLGWQQNLGQVFRDWDVFAMPSLEEGFGMAALEAMAAGLPVVATSAGGLAELIEDGETGYLVPPADVAGLTERLRLLVLDPERRRTMGAAARNRVRLHFAADRMVRQIEAIYAAILPLQVPAERRAADEIRRLAASDLHAS
jgi:glycosyltransferase involved in cell wall biosynthesis